MTTTFANKENDVSTGESAAHWSVAKSLRELALSFWKTVRRSYDRVESNLVPVSLCGAVGMPVYYFVWHDLFPQPYENLWLRLIGTAVCLVLALKDFWPRTLRPVLPALWYAPVLYALPFFFCFPDILIICRAN